jgi:hypothetical protein
MFPLGPRMTALEVLQQQCLQNALGTQGLNGLLPAGLSQTNQLTEAQLATLVRPMLLQQAEQQQQQQAQDLEAQLLIQEQIKILRARLVAQILSRT